MSARNVVVSWKRVKHTIEVEPEDTLLDFKLKVLSCTEVSPENQKLISGGRTLKDDDNMFSELNPKYKDVFLLEMKQPQQEEGSKPSGASVGEKDAAAKGDGKMEIEDDAEDEGKNLPTGLHNLGNTCFLNATLQCMNTVPELREALCREHYKRQEGRDFELTRSMGRLFRELSESEYNYIEPGALLEALKQRYPEMVVKEERFNMYQQQDAEECWLKVLSSLNNTLNTKDGVGIERYFTGEFETTLRNTESEEEQPRTRKDMFLKLATRISKETSHLSQGITQALSQTVEKDSEALGRTAKYESTSLISRLPKYLTVHLLRFEFRRDVENTAKIMRAIDLPMELNLAHHCTKELREKLMPVQRYVESVRDAKITGRQTTQTLDEVIDAELGKDTGCNESGLYELTAVITHQGRTANSGHYIAWAKVPSEDYPKNYNQHERNHDLTLWYEFNDHDVKIVHQKDIKNLFGGRGDSPTIYLALYSAKKIE